LSLIPCAAAFGSQTCALSGESSPSAANASSTRPGPLEQLSGLDLCLLRHWRCLEVELRPDPLLLTRPNSSDPERVTPRMRTILVSWLSEVALQFQFRQETLFMAVSVLDRFLSVRTDVSRDSLQMVGTCCLMIAAKHEEVFERSTHDYVEIADNSFTLRQLLRCETDILSAVGWRINAPTAASYLSLYHSILWPHLWRGSPDADGAEGSGPLLSLAMYLAELAGLERDMLRFLPSTVAAASLAVAARATGAPLGGADAAALASLAAPAMAEAAASVAGVHARACALSNTDSGNPWVAVKEKYSHRVWKKVALIAPSCAEGRGE